VRHDERRLLAATSGGDIERLVKYAAVGAFREALRNA